jgi:hypothetical protein
MTELVFQAPEPEPERQIEICRRRGCTNEGTSLITVRFRNHEDVFIVCKMHKEEYDQDNLPIAEQNQHAAALRIRMKAERTQRDKYE